MSDSGEFPELLALHEWSFESCEAPEPGELGTGDGAVSGGDGGLERRSWVVELLLVRQSIVDRLFPLNDALIITYGWEDGVSSGLVNN